jgi:lysophospholipase-3
MNSLETVIRLWENFTALQEDPALSPCYADQLRLVYDPVAGDYRNVPGVDTRVVSFGSTRGFRSDDPARK